MRIQHIRNATTLVTLGEHVILIDPMFCDPGAMPGFKLFGGGRRPNPLTPLPPGARASMDAATAVLVTHEHPDHFDPLALKWARERRLPVFASSTDAPNLESKGLAVEVARDAMLGMNAQEIPAAHGRGVLGWMMGPVAGFFLAHPEEPSLYVTGDTVLTPEVRDAVTRLQPDVILAPAGAANFGVGGDVIFSVEELVTLAHLTPTSSLVFNHLEALDHCPTTRAGLRQRMDGEGVGARVHIPEDGEVLVFEDRQDRTDARLSQRPPRTPGLQKWVTAKFTGT